jgi:hypothetical protein
MSGDLRQAEKAGWPRWGYLISVLTASLVRMQCRAIMNPPPPFVAAFETGRRLGVAGTLLSDRAPNEGVSITLKALSQRERAYPPIVGRERRPEIATRPHYSR